MRIKDLTGQRFGRLVALKIVSHKPVKWECICDCGNTVVVASCHLTSGHTQSCGCYMRDRTSEANSIDLSGHQFGRLTAIQRKPDHITRGGNPLTVYECKCNCGNTLDVLAMNLVSGNTVSCGCYWQEQASDAFLDDLTGQTFGRLTVVDRATNIGDKTVWRCKCNCGRTTNVLAISLKRGNTRSCGCIKASAGEALTSDYLKNHKINYETEYWFDDLRSPLTDRHRPLRFDFALLDDKQSLVCLLEYNGEQHYYEDNRDIEFGKKQRDITDQLKRDYCSKNNIPLFEIRYDDDLNEKLDNVLAFYISRTQ